MAERTESQAAITDALASAENLVSIVEAIRQVARLPDAPVLGITPRKIIISQLCSAAADQCHSFLGEVSVLHTSVSKADA